MLPEEQQDREQHDKQTAANITCAYQKSLLGESSIDPSESLIRVRHRGVDRLATESLTWTVGPLTR
jgi:hypothetical protein